MHESVSTYTNYNHYESTILELSHFKKSGDYGNGARRYRCLDCGKAFSPLTGTLFDANKIPISEWIEYMIHLFEFHSLSSSAIKEDMDFLNDIDKESLTDALILEYPHLCFIALNIKRIILCFLLFLL